MCVRASVRVCACVGAECMSWDSLTPADDSAVDAGRGSCRWGVILARISTTWQVHHPNFIECIFAQVFEFTVIALQARVVMPAKQSIEKPSSRLR